MFVVEGGIYTDTDFKVVEPGTEECYGPFETHCKAVEEWSGRARAKIDICCHRLFIRRKGD